MNNAVSDPCSSSGGGGSVTVTRDRVIWCHYAWLDSACGAWPAAVAGENWLAIGDAALAFDPIAAQGLFNAMYTGLAAAHAVTQWTEGDRAPLPVMQMKSTASGTSAPETALHGIGSKLAGKTTSSGLGAMTRSRSRNGAETGRS